MILTPLFVWVFVENLPALEVAFESNVLPIGYEVNYGSVNSLFAESSF